jgi:Leucine-rich repeat (LRR) protein
MLMLLLLVGYLSLYLQLFDGCGALQCEIGGTELTALEDLYNSCNGLHWQWDFGSPSTTIWTFPTDVSVPCSRGWQGLVCKSTGSNSSTCSITALELRRYGLEGPLPSTINGLSNLVNLNMSINHINATIPQSLALMTSLQLISLSDNALTGPLPDFGGLVNLLSFGADNNNISSSIPASVCSSSSLRRFSITGNNVSGALPECFYDLIGLFELNIRDNKMTGSISSKIGSLSAAGKIDMGMNSFRGSLPSQLGNLSILSYLAVDDNRLTSTIPVQLGQTQNLHVLYLSENFLQGSIPTELGRLTSLEIFAVDSNQLIGSIPSELRNLSSLISVNLGFNRLVGRLPSPLSQFNQLDNFNVSNNFLTGWIPSDYGNLTLLNRLDLSSNALTGSLPSTLCRLRELTFLYANNNSITGELPNCIGSAADLLFLKLQNNYLAGTIPESIIHLQDLIYLDISSNLFNGLIPVYIAELSSLLVLLMHNNSISGTIPSELAKLKNLTVLNLSASKLSGTIPTFLSDLSELQYLNLSMAIFHGTLPNEIVGLPSLFSFYVNYNYLYGHLPEGLNEGTATALKYLSLSHNKFSGTVSSKLISLPQLQILDLYYNSFTGQLPFIEGLQCDLLYYLDLGKNEFEGTLPNNWTSYKALQYLLVNHNKLSGTLPSLVMHEYSSVSLNQFDVHHNNLHGPIPEGLYTHTGLFELLLGDNNFYGTISSSIMQLQQLATLDLSGNKFRSNLGEAFLSPLPLLHLLNLANNSFFGRIPDQLVSPNLTLLDLSSNCFSGTLPAHICSARSLDSLLLNALSSDDLCQVYVPRVLNFAFRGIFPYKRMAGSIPDCFFQVSGLKYLRVGGNKLTGTIPSIPVAGGLYNLDLSFNALTGSIPATLQTSGQFKYMSLQSNRLTGTLLPDFAVSNADSDGTTTNLSLSVNRLSGEIPQSFYHVQQNLNILTGNLFDCRISNPLPAADPGRETFACGSVQFNTAMFIWLDFFWLFGSVLVVCYLFLRRYESHDEGSVGCPAAGQAGQIDREDSETSSEMRISSRELELSSASLRNIARVLRSQEAESPLSGLATPGLPLRPSLFVATAFSSFQQWLHYDFAHNEMLSSTHKFFVGLKKIWRGLAIWSLLYLGLLFLYVSLKCSFQDFRTVTVQELWVTTALFLHGYVPVIFLSFVLVVGLLLILSVIDAEQLRSTTAQRNKLKESQRAKQRYHSFMESLFCGGCVDNFLYPTVAHIANLVFAVSVNAVYVSRLPTIPTHYVFLFQAAMSAAKTLWINLYIPYIMRRLYYLSVTSRFQTQIVMLLVNYLLAPLLATLGANENCLYYVFERPPRITSVFLAEALYCYPELTVSITQQQSEPLQLHSAVQPFPGHQPITYETSIDCFIKSGDVNEYTVPPFIYNYNCAFSFLAGYIPVLIYSYLISAIFVPLFRLFLLYCSQSFIRRRLGDRLYDTFIRDTIHDYESRLIEQQGVRRVSLTASFNVAQSQANSVASETTEVSRRYVVPLFDGSAVIARRTLDVTTMMTFGMACPLLAFTITISVYIQCVVWRLMIGKYLSQVGAGSTLAIARLERSFGDGLPQGTLGGLRVAVLVISGFWAFIFFDMVGDLYGPYSGVGVSVGCFMFVPLLLYSAFTLKDKAQARKAWTNKTVSSIQLTRNISGLQFNATTTPELPEEVSNSIFAATDCSR